MDLGPSLARTPRSPATWHIRGWQTSQAKLNSSPANSPGNLLDANLLSRLLIVIIPLTIREVNSRERSVTLGALHLPITLEKSEKHAQKLEKGRTYVGLEVGKLEAAAVYVDNLLALLLLLGFVDVRAGDDAGGVGFLVVLAWMYRDMILC